MTTDPASILPAIACDDCHVTSGLCVYTSGPNAGKPRAARYGPHAVRVADSVLAARWYDRGVSAGAASRQPDVDAARTRAESAEKALAACEAEHEPEPPKPIPGRSVSFLMMPEQIALGGYWDKNYLNPHGEADKWYPYGGFTRDAPAGPGDPKNLAIAAAKEVADAKAAGGDSFHLIIAATGDTNHWPRSKALMKAASDTDDFRIIPMIEAAGGSTAAKTPAVIAGFFKELYDVGPDGWLVEDGELVLSGFTAEAKTPDWWAQVKAATAAAIGKPVRFEAVFQNYSTSNFTAFKDVAYSFGKWGDPAPAVEASARDACKEAHAAGKRWTQPVRPRDARHRSSNYAEARNTELWRTGWDRAITDDAGKGADRVLVVTWNDFAESTQICPSRNHGTAWSRLSAFYADWYRTGTMPTITTPWAVLTHRIQPYAAKPSLTGQNAMTSTLGGGGKAGNGPRDTVGLLTFLPTAGQVSINGGAWTDVAAGVVETLAPLTLGTQTASYRLGGVVVEIDSPYPVSAAPVVWDVDYRAAASG